jgi:hypothetical protein
MPINSQEKGKRAERDLANWFKVNGYPDAGRAVKTGTIQTHDAGDLILEHETPGFPVFRLCVEVKHHAGGLTDLQVNSFCDKLSMQCLMSRANMGILVERRDRVSDPGRWWVYVHASDFARLEIGQAVFERLAPIARFRPVRVQLAYLSGLLRRAGLAYQVDAVPTSDRSGHVASGTAAERSQAVGGSR